jgi:hypothetical protein
MTAELSKSCVVCASYQQAQQKEPLMSHPAPDRPLEKVGLD